jgi:hypothetical protein
LCSFPHHTSWHQSTHRFHINAHWSLSS